MNIQLPDNIPVISIIKFAASVGCEVKFQASGNLKLEQKQPREQKTCSAK